MEQDSKVNELTNPYQNLWDKYSFAYFSAMNKNSISLMCNLLSLTRAYKKLTILDAGCGPGLGTKQITLDIPSYNSTVYAFDFSGEMVNLCEKVFSEYEDFNANHHNHYEMCKLNFEDKISIVKDTEEIRKTKIGKVVKFFQGNVEKLPFENEQFEVYLSNLCIMLCDDVDKAICEAYRVLKNDGVAAFSIWGNKDNTKLSFKLFSQFYQKYGIDVSGERSSYWLAQDLDALRNRFTKAGFKDVRMEYTTEIFDCYDEQDYLVKFQGPGVNVVLEKMNDEQKVKDLLEDVKNEAKKQISDLKNIPTLNCLVIVAFK